MKQKEIRTTIGLLIWIGIFSGGLLLARHSLDRSPAAVSQLAQFVGQQRRTIEIKLPSQQLLRVGDPVFLSGDEYARIGHVSRIESANSTNKELAYTETAFVEFYGAAPPISDHDRLDYHYAPDSTGWVLKTMLPPAKRKEIGKLIVEAYARNRNTIVTAMRPVVKDSLREASSIIKDDMKAAFAKREDRIREIGQKYQNELIEKELVPLIQSEIWPIIQSESEPLAEEVGQEIWQEVSVFRFGWRYLYDTSPLPDQNLAQGEFDRFLDGKVIPILKSHVDEFLEVQTKVVARVAANEKVKKTMSQSLKTIVNDPDIQIIFTEVFQEVFSDNRRLHDAMEKHWKSPQAKQAVDLATQQLEPTVTEIGKALFGSPHEQITPEFARTLRHRILHKDTRWLTLHLADPNADPNRRVSSPALINVQIAEPVGEVPYAPARERN